MPFIPSRNANPCSGTLDVPVTNWRNLARSAWSNDLSARQNHWICAPTDHSSMFNGFKFITERPPPSQPFYLLTATSKHRILLLLQLRPFVWDYPGEPVPEETFTHSPILIIIQPLSASSIYSIHSILPVQFTCLTNFLHNLFPSPLWSTCWSGALHLILHTFLYPISVFFSEHWLIIIIIIQYLYSALKSCKGYRGAGGFRLSLSKQVCFEVFFKGVYKYYISTLV